MLKDLLARLGERLDEWRGPREKLPSITERTKIKTLIEHYPETANALKHRFHLELRPEHMGLSLKAFAHAETLPAPQILFMEIQMFERARRVSILLPHQASQLLKTEALKVLDVRETWELKFGAIPRAETLSPEGMEFALEKWPKETPLLLYCHFGVRSLDAAVFFTDHGFTNVSCLKGGIDAWAIEIDPSLQRYESAWC